MRLGLIGSRTRAGLLSMNGTKVTEFDPDGPMPERKQQWEPEPGPRPEIGYIGLQSHEDYDPNTQVYFREVSEGASHSPIGNSGNRR